MFPGEEGVPIQVDGEAWTQPPGIVRIVHKNRVQMLCRNRVRTFWSLYIVNTSKKEYCDRPTVQNFHTVVVCGCLHYYFNHFPYDVGPGSFTESMGGKAA